MPRRAPAAAAAGEAAELPDLALVPEGFPEVVARVLVALAPAEESVEEVAEELLAPVTAAHFGIAAQVPAAGEVWEPAAAPARAGARAPARAVLAAAVEAVLVGPAVARAPDPAVPGVDLVLVLEVALAAAVALALGKAPGPGRVVERALALEQERVPAARAADLVRGVAAQVAPVEAARQVPAEAVLVADRDLAVVKADPAGKSRASG